MPKSSAPRQGRGEQPGSSESVRRLLRYAAPIALSALGSVVVGFIDTIIVGRYSAVALSGVAMGAAVYELPINALLGALMAYRILAPRTGDVGGHGLRRLLRSLLPIATAIAVLLIVASYLVTIYSTVPLYAAAGEYMLGRAPSVVLETVSTAFIVALVTWGWTRAPVIAFVTAAGINVLLDVVLVYGLGPFPRWGAFGDGVASSVGQAVSVAVLYAAIGRKAVLGPLRHRADFDGWPRLALPAVLTAAVDYAGNLLFTALMASAGAASLAGARVGVQVHLLAFVLISSLSSAALFVFGDEYGNKQQGGDAGGSEHIGDDGVEGEHGEQYVWAGTGEAKQRNDHGRTSIASHSEVRSRILGQLSVLQRQFLGLSACLGVAICALAVPLAWAVSDDAAVRGTAIGTTVLVGALCPIMGWAYVNVTLLRLNGRTDSDFVSNTVAVWAAQIPIAWAGLMLAGGVGAFAGLGAYWIVRATYSRLQVKRVAERFSVSQWLS